MTGLSRHVSLRVLASGCIHAVVVSPQFVTTCSFRCVGCKLVSSC